MSQVAPASCMWWHVLGGVGEDVADDSHGELGRIDVGVADHELLEDIVLDGTGHLLELGTLLLSRYDVEGQDRQNGTVHGHGHGHLVQRYLVEEHLHVLYAADGHTGLADVTHYSGMVSVVASVCSQVKGDGKSLLAGSEVPAVESVGLLGCGESGILTDGPGPHHVHGAVGSAEERRKTCGVVQVLHSLIVLGGVDLLHADVLRSLPNLL